MVIGLGIAAHQCHGRRHIAARMYSNACISPSGLSDGGDDVPIGVTRLSSFSRRSLPLTRTVRSTSVEAPRGIPDVELFYPVSAPRALMTKPFALAMAGAFPIRLPSALVRRYQT